MIKLFFVFVLVFNLQGFSQDFLKLFAHHIPENIKIDEVMSNSLDLNLQRNAALNPELIYLTLNYYQQYDGSKFDTQLFEMLKSNERIWITTRTKWAANMLEEIELTDNPEIIRNAEIDLKKLIIVVRSKEDDRLVVLTYAEKQLRDFYIVKYYNSDPEMKFDKEVDYISVRSQIESDKKLYFVGVKENPEMLSSPKEIVKNIINNWYLLYDDPELEASDILITSLVDVLSDKSRNIYSLFIGNVFINNTIDFDESIDFPGIDHTVRLNSTASLPQFSLGIGYKLYFSNRSLFLSYVDIQLFYSKGYSEKTSKQSVVYKNTEVNGNFTTEESLRNFDDNYILSSLNSYGLKLSIPMYENDFLTLEAAFTFSLNSYLYKPDMYFTFSKYRTEYDSNGQPVARETLALGSQTIKDEVTEEYLSIIPMIDMSVKIYNRLGAKISASYNYAALNLFYNTALFF